MVTPNPLCELVVECVICLDPCDPPGNHNPCAACAAYFPVHKFCARQLESGPRLATAAAADSCPLCHSHVARGAAGGKCPPEAAPGAAPGVALSRRTCSWSSHAICALISAALVFIAVCGVLQTKWTNF